MTSHQICTTDQFVKICTYASKFWHKITNRITEQKKCINKIKKSPEKAKVLTTMGQFNIIFEKRNQTRIVLLAF